MAGHNEEALRQAPHGQWSMSASGSFIRVQLVGSFNDSGGAQMVEELLALLRLQGDHAPLALLFELRLWLLHPPEVSRDSEAYIRSLAAHGVRAFAYVIGSSGLRHHVIEDIWANLSDLRAIRGYFVTEDEGCAWLRQHGFIVVSRQCAEK